MLSVEVLRPLLRAAWGPDTCDPHDLKSWWPGNPARGQCGVTALVVQDLFGGDLILAEVHVEGVKVGHHYWNLLLDGTEIDFTAGQFHAGEVVTGGRLQHARQGRPAGVASSTSCYEPACSQRCPPVWRRRRGGGSAGLSGEYEHDGLGVVPIPDKALIVGQCASTWGCCRTARISITALPNGCRRPRAVLANVRRLVRV